MNGGIHWLEKTRQADLYIILHVRFQLSMFLFSISKTLRICRLSVGNLEALVKLNFNSQVARKHTKPKHFVISEGSCKLNVYVFNEHSLGWLKKGCKQNHLASSPWFGLISDEASSGLSVNLSTPSVSLSVYNLERFVLGPLVTVAESLYLSWKP